MPAFDPTYLPALGYLLVVTLLVFGARRCPTWVHPVALAVGLPMRISQASDWTEAAVPAAVAAALFVVLVFIAARLVSGVSLFTLVTTLALLSFDGWVAALVGLGLAAAVSVVRTTRALGGQRVQVLAFETFNAVGVSPASGGLVRPDTSRLLDRSTAVDVTADTALAKKVRMHLPPYLLTGALLGALISGSA